METRSQFTQKRGVLTVLKKTQSVKVGEGGGFLGKLISDTAPKQPILDEKQSPAPEKLIFNRTLKSSMPNNANM